MKEILNGVRQLIRRPRFSIVVISILALGIGATTAMYSSFHAILVRPLPVPNPERLVNLRVPGLHLGGTTTSNAGSEEYVFSYAMFRDLEAAEQSPFAGVAAHTSFPANLAQEGSIQAGTGMLVSGSYFDVLDLRPALGRLIGIEDEPRVGESAVAVLSYDYWQNGFGGDTGVLGTTMVVNGQSLTIIGVAPPGFHGTTLGSQPEVFVPITLRWLMQPSAGGSAESRFAYWLYLFARLKPGVTRIEAAASINVLHAAILAEVEAPLLSGVPADRLETYLARPMLLEPGDLGQSVVRARAGLPLMLLLGLTISVLLIVCVNIANLLLARGISRMREMAVRKSLGARNTVLARQLLVEAGVLAVFGGVLSLPVSSFTLAAIASISPVGFAQNLALEFDRSTSFFIVTVVLAVSMSFGLLPAIQASRANPGQVIGAHSARSIGSPGIGRIRGALVSLQVAFSLVLLVLAGLFAQSLSNVSSVDVGMSTQDVVTFDLAPRLNGYESERAMLLADRIEVELMAQPGITSAASSWVRPLINDYARGFVMIDGVENAPGADSTAWFNAVSPAFFDTLSVGLLAGRKFTGADSAGSPGVAIVNESFVRKFGLGDDVIGQRFSGANNRTFEIVGLVEDAKYSSVKAETEPQYFLPRRQYSDFETLTFYVSGTSETDAVMRMIPRVVADIDSNLPVSQLITLRRVVQNNVFLDRMVSLLSVGFAGLAILLAAIGLYSVLAYNVEHRTREFGLRQALGAKPRDLRTIVFRQVVVLAATGLIVGLVAAFALGRVAESLLFGLTGSEPAIFAAAVGGLISIVAVSGWVPAHKASRVAPMLALRDE